MDEGSATGGTADGDDAGTLIDQLCSVSDACFGEGYLGPERFRAVARVDGSTHLLALVDGPDADSPRLLCSARGETADPERHPGGTVLGFALVGLYTPRRLAEHLHVPPAEWPSVLHTAEQVAFPRSIAVRPDGQDSDYARLLTEAGYELLEAADPDAWCAVAWERADGTVAVDSALQAAGFEPRRTVEEYWRRESLAEEYTCLDCGDPPCTCSGRFYLRE